MSVVREVGLYLITSSKPEQIFNGSVSTCEATTPSSLSLTSDN